MNKLKGDRKGTRDVSDGVGKGTVDAEITLHCCL